MKMNTLRMILLAVILSIISVNSLRRVKEDCKPVGDTGMTEKQNKAIQRGKDALAAYKVYQTKDSKEWFEGELLTFTARLDKNSKNQDAIEKESAELSKKEQTDAVTDRQLAIGKLRGEYADLANSIATEMTTAFDKRWERRMAEFKKTQDIVFAAIDEAMSGCVEGAGIKIGEITASLKETANKKEAKPAANPNPKRRIKKF